MVTQNPRHRINQHTKPNFEYAVDKDWGTSCEGWRDEYARVLRESIDFAVESAWFEVKTAADAVAAEAIRAAFSEAAV